MILTLTGDSKSTIINKDTLLATRSARLLCEDVYNVAQGQIVDIQTSDGRAVVNVKCNPSEILRYGNLVELNCKKTYNAEIGAKLGIADEYVIFEYCTLWQGTSVYPVRVNGWTYYKQDPSDVLNGTYVLRKDGAQEQGYVSLHNRTTFNDEQKKYFGENIYDKFSTVKSSQKWSTNKSIQVLRSLGVTHRINKNTPIPVEEDEDIGEG